MKIIATDKVVRILEYAKDLYINKRKYLTDEALQEIIDTVNENSWEVDDESEQTSKKN